MQESVIRPLRKQAFAAVIRPLKSLTYFRGEVLGFDTEYTSREGEYLSTQLAASAEVTSMHTDKLTVDRLAAWVKDLVPTAEQVILATYFSLAELQFLPVREESFGWREFGSGSFDCSFYSSRENLSIRIFDIARFFERQSLARVAESFGLQKLEWARDKVTRADLRKKGFREYAINDAVLAVEIFNRLRNEFLAKNVDIATCDTPARTASTYFRAAFVDAELRNTESRARYAGMRAAWGGRAEVYRRGKFSRLYEYDLPSAYPNAAVELSPLPTTKNWREISCLLDALKCDGGFAHVAFEFPASEIYPCLPVVAHGKQFYPLEGAEWVTFAELEYAWEIGAKITLIEAWGYRGGTNCLRDYMREALAEREKARGVRKIAAKLLSNSLIGKLAQRTNKVSADDLYQFSIENDVDLESLMSLSGDELVALGLPATISVGSCFMPEWNALITGLTRAKISRLVREYDAVYCATDGLWVTSKISNPPFGLTCKRQGAGSVYRTRVGNIGEHVVHHAIHSRAHARSIIVDGAEPGAYDVRRPLKLRESLATGQTLGTWVRETKTSSLEWDGKRRLLDNGKETVPWRCVKEYQNWRSVHTKRKRNT